MSDTTADYDRDAAALALSETGVYPECELPSLDTPDAPCESGAMYWRPDANVLVCDDHWTELERNAAHASGAV